MPTYAEWEKYFGELSSQKLVNYQKAIGLLMEDPMIHKNWGELSTLAVLMDNELHQKKRAQRPIVTGSFGKKTRKCK